MRASTAYFVGAGTIVAAIAIGLGGGLVAGNIMNPITPKQAPDSGKPERRAEPVAATNAPSERVQFLRGSQAFGAVFTPPAQVVAQTTPVKAEPQAAQPTKPVDKSAEQQASTEQASSPENAYAKAKDSDVKRATSERRRADRRQHWAERRRNEMRGRTDWDDVARNVHEDSDGREFSSSPRRGFPQIRLFGPDDD
jgi:hypothetical protein